MTAPYLKNCVFRKVWKEWKSFAFIAALLLLARQKGHLFSVPQDSGFTPLAEKKIFLVVSSWKQPQIHQQKNGQSLAHSSDDILLSSENEVTTNKHNNTNGSYVHGEQKN